MKIQTTHGTWADLKNKLAKNYPHLTEKDLYYEDGMEYKMLRKVEYKLHMNKEDMQALIETL